MHADPTTHPTADELAAFSLGKLSDAATLAVAGHLETCRDCRKAAGNVAPDTFVGILQAARAALPAATPAPGVMPSRLGASPSMVSGQALPADADLELPPELADHPRFRILRVLGRGGMGVVYLAEHRLMQQMRAVKVISKSLLDHPEALPRFHREVQTAAQLDHRNIVRAYDAEQAGNLHMLVMEYVEGFDLAKVLERKGPLPVPHSCHYVRQAALGLQHAFERGMVHRDIKPQNLLLVPEKGLVKVTDFGLARLASERQQGKGLTAQNAVMGTPEYIAPEQATDARSADIRADVYSLGCTLYCLLAGRPPFQEATPVKMILAHLDQQATPLHEVRPEVPRELSAVVAKMMAKEREKRYQTPKEAAEALAGFCKPGAKVVPTRTTMPRPVAQLSTGTVCAADTNPVPTPQASVAPTSDRGGEARALPAAPAASPWEELATTAPAPQLEKKPEKRRAPVGPKAGPPRWWLFGGAAAAAVVLTAGILIYLQTRDGMLVLEIDPPDASITIAGEEITVTERGGESLKIKYKPGTYKLQVSKDGFLVHAQEVTVEAGKSLRVTASLQRLPQPQPPLVQKPQTLEETVPLRLWPASWLLNTIGEGKWRVDGQELLQAEGGNTVYAAIEFGDPQWTDYDLALEFNKTSRIGGVEAWVRATTEAGYLFGIDCGEGPHAFGYHVLKPPRRFKDLLVEHVDPRLISHMTWHKASVQVRGRFIKCFVDGRLLLEGENGRYSTGAVRLGTYQTSARFRNLKITAPDGRVLFEGLPNPGKAKVQKAADTQPDKREGEPGWAPLFNGKDLTGWRTHFRQPGDWKVENGVLVGRGPTISHLYSGRDDYENFHVRAEVRISDGGNSGIKFRAPFGPQLPTESPEWASGYEAEISLPQERKPQTGSLHVGGIPGIVSIWDSPVKPNEWFTYEIIADGNSIRLVVDGKEVVKYMDQHGRYSRGHLALQVDGRSPTVVEFRKIEIKELPPDQPSTSTLKPVGTDWMPLFNGLDLTGWVVDGGDPKAWRVERGELVFVSNRESRGWLLTQREFADFILRFEFQLASRANSGVTLRARPGEKHLEIQLLDDSHPAYRAEPLIRRTGALWNLALERGAPLRPVGSWNAMEVEARGKTLRVAVNGQQVLQTELDRFAKLATDIPALQRGAGRIGLQYWEGTVRFRRIEIKELP